MVEHGTSLVKFGLISPNAIPFFEERLWEIISSNPEGLLSFMSFEEVMAYLHQDKLELWIGADDRLVELVVLTQVAKHQHKSFLYVIWMGGTNILKYRRQGLKKLELFAACHKVHTINFNGTERMGKALQNLGFVPKYIEFTKKVSYTRIDNGEFERKH